MKIRVLFFGATAEAAGIREIDVEADAGTTASEVFAGILTTYPKLSEHKLLYALNQQYADGGEKVSDGDEIAVFTAVSGG